MGMAVNRVCIMVRYDNTTNQFICTLGNEERMEIVDAQIALCRSCNLCRAHR